MWWADTLTAQMQPPDIYLAIHNIQSELIELSTKQNYNDSILRKVQTEVRDIQTSFRVFQGTLNSILTRISDKATATQVKTLQTCTHKVAVGIAAGYLTRHFVSSSHGCLTWRLLPHRQPHMPPKMDYANVVANSCQSNPTEKARLTQTPKTSTQDTLTIPSVTPTNIQKHQSPNNNRPVSNLANRKSAHNNTLLPPKTKLTTTLHNSYITRNMSNHPGHSLQQTDDDVTFRTSYLISTQAL